MNFILAPHFNPIFRLILKLKALPRFYTLSDTIVIEAYFSKYYRLVNRNCPGEGPLITF